MSIIRKLAISLNRRDEVPNIELAAAVAETNDRLAVSELIHLLNHRDKAIRHDCIKVLYEIARLRPALVADHYRLFVAMLGNADNRLRWGAMTALDHVTKEKPHEIFISLKEIIRAANSGSVITRDHCVNILIQLSTIDKYSTKVFPLLLDQMSSCPTNQLPMYAENARPIINPADRDRFVQVLSSRLGEIEKESKRKRVEKVIRQVSK